VYYVVHNNKERERESHAHRAPGFSLSLLSPLFFPPPQGGKKTKWWKQHAWHTHAHTHIYYIYICVCACVSVMCVGPLKQRPPWYGKGRESKMMLMMMMMIVSLSLSLSSHAFCFVLCVFLIKRKEQILGSLCLRTGLFRDPTTGLAHYTQHNTTLCCAVFL
jgi:membrane-associated HD superfamily phosphohydrolase